MNLEGLSGSDCENLCKNFPLAFELSHAAFYEDDDGWVEIVYENTTISCVRCCAIDFMMGFKKWKKLLGRAISCLESLKQHGHFIHDNALQACGFNFEKALTNLDMN